MISQLSARAPDSHLTKARANSGKFINHGTKTFGSTINSTLAVLVQSTNISCEFSPPPFYVGLLSYVIAEIHVSGIINR